MFNLIKYKLKSNKLNNNNKQFIKIVIANNDYIGKYDGELSFNAGDKFQVIDQTDPDWYKVKHINNGDLGLVPSKYLFEVTIKTKDTHISSVYQTLVQSFLKQQSNIDCNDEINRRDLKVIRMLGSGNFGTVFYGIFKGHSEVTIKTIKPNKISWQAFLNEAVIIGRCSHDNISKMYGVCSIGEPLLIVTEFMRNGTLLDYLRNSPKGKALKLLDLIDMCAQIASGMSYLESIKIVHRVLAARSVLVGHNNEVKVCCFGFARIMEDEYVARDDDMLSIKWTAPEAVLFGKYTTKSDVWSYGILLYEMITYGEVPYKGMRNRVILDQVSKRKYRLPKPTGVEYPDVYYNLMLQCWDEVPENRPTFEYLYYFFKYFKKYYKAFRTLSECHKAEDEQHIKDTTDELEEEKLYEVITSNSFYDKMTDNRDFFLTTENKKINLEDIRDTGLSNEFDRRDLKMFNKLGSGNFGTVFYGTLLGKLEVAIKQLNPGIMSSQAFLDEAVIMRKCRHDKIVKFYGVCSIGEPLLIVTEFVRNGALLEYLRDNPKGKVLKLRDLIDMCAQIACGMSYLESIKLDHRDLAARNILVGDNNEVKVADFGLARIIEDEEYVSRNGSKFPAKWTAPEAAFFGKYSTKSDIWSYGILLYEIITYGEVPYKGMQNIDVLVQVSQHKYRLPKPTCVECPDYYYDMILKCWDEVPENRPTFEDLYHFFEHYFFSPERQNHRQKNEQHIENTTEELVDEEMLNEVIKRNVDNVLYTIIL